MKPEDLLGEMPEGAGEFEPPPEVRPMTRADRFSIESMTDHSKLVSWMNKTRKAPIEGIDSMIVNRSYAAAVWLFRAAAVNGDLKGTKAMEAWLAWAKPIITATKRERKTPPLSQGSVAFLPRTPSGDEEESE